MSNYIMDMLGDVDEKLLEEALDLPQQANEVVFEADERHKRRSIFGAAAAIAASLVVVAAVVIFRANFGKISALPNDGGGEISGSDVTSGGIIIPKEFTEEDMELQRLLTEISPEALELCGYFCYNTDSIIYTNYCFLFPQMEKPITHQFDTYHYYYCADLSLQEIKKRLADSFSAEAAAEFVKYIVSGKTVNSQTFGEKSGSEYRTVDITVEITEGGDFDSNGYLIEPPSIIELDQGAIYQSENHYGRDFSGYWSTAKVISRTDDEIVFSYVYENNGGLYEDKGRLVNENGWKFSWYGNWIF